MGDRGYCGSSPPSLGWAERIGESRPAGLGLAREVFRIGTFPAAGVSGRESARCLCGVPVDLPDADVTRWERYEDESRYSL